MKSVSPPTHKKLTHFSIQIVFHYVKRECLEQEEKQKYFVVPY